MKTPALHLALERLPTPIGELLILNDDRQRLRAIDWSDYETRMQRLLRLHYGASGYTLTAATTASENYHGLAAYFSGELRAIDSLSVATGGTPFQRSVWAALREIPAGRTISYGALATQIGRAKAVRAVGLANGSNPVGIVVPCHRVIGADASLTGYGGGIERKRWLLEHEGVAAGAASAKSRKPPP
ncbi:MAG: methylated-DNA--[protein]-cysteine S-methyltransferase [Steroidobacteraceae bacterium]